MVQDDASESGQQRRGHGLRSFAPVQQVIVEGQFEQRQPAQIVTVVRPAGRRGNIDRRRLRGRAESPQGTIGQAPVGWRRRAVIVIGHGKSPEIETKQCNEKVAG